MKKLMRISMKKTKYSETEKIELVVESHSRARELFEAWRKIWHNDYYEYWWISFPVSDNYESV